MAEQALGRPYPLEYRTLLTVANGFPDYWEGNVLLGTSGVGTVGTPGYPADYPGSVWGCAREYIDTRYDMGVPDYSPQDPADCIPLVCDPDGVGACYVVASSGDGWEAGTVVSIGSSGIELFPSIRAYLHAQLVLASTD